MASGGTPQLAGTGIKSKTNIEMALWGILSPEGPCCFSRSPPSSLDRATKMKTIPEEGYDIRIVQELHSHNNVKTVMIYAHVLNRGGKGEEA